MTVGIVGLGLIGGSIGLALRKPGRTILGHDPSEAAGKTALERQCIDKLVPIAEFDSAEVIFIAAPPGEVIPSLETLLQTVPEQVAITDCASVKGEIVAWAKANKVKQFVPGHPMAGHEKSGAAFSSAWLFRHARWILTPLPSTDREALKKVEALVKDMGATPLRMNAATHDRQVAILSHLPHVMAALLVRAGEELESAEIAGGSWKDLTRVGGVDPVLWSQIFLGNRVELSRILEESSAKMEALKQALEREDSKYVLEFMKEAAKAKAKHEVKPASSRAATKRTIGRRRP